MLNLDTESEVMEGVAFIASAPKLMQILDAVSAVYMIGKMDIVSVRRQAHLVGARQAFYWLSSHMTPRTYSEIGRFLGGREHSTVTHGIRQIDRCKIRHKAKLRAVCARMGVRIEELDE